MIFWAFTPLFTFMVFVAIVYGGARYADRGRRKQERHRRTLANIDRLERELFPHWFPKQTLPQQGKYLDLNIHRNTAKVRKGRGFG